MLIPNFFKGTMKDCKKRAKQAVKRYLKGIPLDSIIQPEMASDPTSNDSLVFLDFGSPMYSRPQDFHMVYLVDEFINAYHRREIEIKHIEAFFNYLTLTAWGALNLLPAMSAQAILLTPSYYLAYIRVIEKYWGDFKSLGSRFTIGDNNGVAIWRISSGIKFALARAGVDNKLLNIYDPAHQEPVNLSEIIPPNLNAEMFKKWIGK
jgi:hypothetical protein